MALFPFAGRPVSNDPACVDSHADITGMMFIQRRATTKAAAATPEEDSVEKPTYTKKMLIDAAATQTGLPVKDVGSVIDSALDIIINRVAAGDKVQFIG